MTAPQSWRLLQLSHRPRRPCPHCGEIHRYFTRMTTRGACLPVLFPPGALAPTAYGEEAEVLVAGPGASNRAREERSAYQQILARVQETSIRCEGCGERFDDLETYRLHSCEVRYQ